MRVRCSDNGCCTARSGLGVHGALDPRPNQLQDYVFQTTSDLSPIHPSEGRPQLSMEESMLSSTFLSPKQPEEEEVPTELVELWWAT